MIRIMICDDNTEELNEIKKHVAACFSKEECHVTEFVNPLEAVAFITQGNGVDIAILDIVMPGLNGIQLAVEMRTLGFKGLLVFLTNANDYAAQSYKVKAYAYLLKPVNEADIRELFRKIEENQDIVDGAGFKVMRRSGVRFVLFSELIYVEVIDHSLYFHLKDGEVLSTYATLREYSEVLLKDPRMVQNNRSFIINMDYISACENRSVIMRDGRRISVPKGYEDFQKKCLDWIFGR